MPPYSWKSREGDQASLGGWPDAVMPSKPGCSPRRISNNNDLVGQIPYRSRITGKDEIVPVTLAIMASRCKLYIPCRCIALFILL
jgi:hypothetical protein